ncbi:TetR/AcrR family transcriptional regulator [Chryseotalea sanaruensis]|uniref:TetR/AcrR family transcriptional regulator n=1 Tax=Chryseotalea sanaruensis TaxID=2482724 RepID=A0A401UDW8_9BACT|nr:TetR/AcrR family transcriptional regulator [Chryseotalea sanaruensis]GCC53091.1 TetR/AcrR family transcriptional regulator [Chryseotalea sanaruensis]
MSLRKEKSARLKVQILEQTLKHVGKRSFEDLYVDDICDKVKISKVTFFKYFPQKEDVLMYYLRICCLQRLVEMRDKPRTGVQGIYYLFEKAAEEYDQYPGLMLSMVAYMADMKRGIKPFPVKPEEKELLHPSIPDIQQVEIQSLDQMLERFTLEAILNKEITKSTATRDISNMLLSNLLGSIITAHTNQISSPKVFFKRNAEWLLNGLQSN